MQKGDLNFLSPEACFAAGTLVHTKNGLKPIEQIKVGDLVLSKHESGKGERAYKRVTKTFVHKDRPVSIVTVGGMQADGNWRGHRFAVTPEHPFWVQDKGWKAIGTLLPSGMKSTKLEIIANENPEFNGHTPYLLQTIPGSHGCRCMRKILVQEGCTLTSVRWS